MKMHLAERLVRNSRRSVSPVTANLARSAPKRMGECNVKHATDQVARTWKLFVMARPAAW